MNPIDLFSIFTQQVPFFLIMITIYIIATIFIKVSKKDISKESSLLMYGIAKILIVLIIPMLLLTYLYAPVIILGIAILFMESGKSKISLLAKDIESINNTTVGKITTKLLEILPLALSIVLVYSILFLAMFPVNITLINIILNVIQIYLIVIIMEISFYVTIMIIRDDLRFIKNKANYENIIKNE